MTIDSCIAMLRQDGYLDAANILEELSGKLNRSAEMQFMLDFVKKYHFVSNSRRVQLRQLWTAYCLHHDLHPDTDAYVVQLGHLWNTVWSDTCSLTSAPPDIHADGYADFEEAMSIFVPADCTRSSEPSSVSEVVDFIMRFHFADSVTEVFTQGCCYWFAAILHQRFPGRSQILYDPVIGHFVTEIDGHQYDIVGDVTGQYPAAVPWDSITDSSLRHRVEADCINFRKEE